MKVVVGLSGGVDSAVAALLLKRAGHDVVGLFMKNWEDDDDDRYCSTREDLVDAVSVAEKIGIDVEAVNFAAEYRDRVFASFLAEYRAGRTPNPDVMCNAEIKFKAFLDHAMALGAERIATGHYARVEERDGRFVLLKGVDPGKDQSYFLWGIDRAVVARMLTPVGELSKAETRAYARRLGLTTAEKEESVEICFVPNDDYVSVLERHLPADAAALMPGPLVTTTGDVIGEHRGFGRYTIGQRRGLGIAAPQASYVLDIDHASKRVVVGTKNELACSGLKADRMNWLEPPVVEEFEAQVQIRYRSPAIPCVIHLKKNNACQVRFNEPYLGVTPGQAAVIYRGERLLGGGWIEHATP